MSVKIIDYKLRESLEGKSFFALVLQGGVEVVKSASGNSYATVKTVSIPSTFDEATCKALIGMEMPGTIHPDARSDAGTRGSNRSRSN